MLDITITEDNVAIKVVDGQGRSCLSESKPFETVLRKRLEAMGVNPDDVITDTELPEMKQAAPAAATQKGANLA